MSTTEPAPPKGPVTGESPAPEVTTAARPVPQATVEPIAWQAACVCGWEGPERSEASDASEDGYWHDEIHEPDPDAMSPTAQSAAADAGRAADAPGWALLSISLSFGWSVTL